MVRPTKLVSPPNRRCQSPWFSTTTLLSLPNLSSSGKNPRPSTGRSRNMSRKVAETCQPVRRSGSPVPVRFTAISDRTESASKLVLWSRQSWKTPPGVLVLPPGLPPSSQTLKSFPGCSNGSGLRMTPLITLKIAEFAPIPSARVRTATVVKPRFLRNIRAPKRTSCPKFSIQLTPRWSRHVSLIDSTQPNCRIAM